MLLGFSDANHIEIAALSIFERGILKVRIGFVPGARFEKASNVRILEDAAVLTKDNTAHEFQVVDRQRVDVRGADTLVDKIECLPILDGGVFILGLRQGGTGQKQKQRKEQTRKGEGGFHRVPFLV